MGALAYVFEAERGGGGAEADGLVLVVEERRHVTFDSRVIPERERMNSGGAHGPVLVEQGFAQGK